MFFQAEVRDLASDGRGIVATPEGLTCFVAGVWLGETGKFRLINKTSKVQEAQLVELLDHSPHRREAPCKFHGHDKEHCGGCAWQFVTYDAQLSAKQQRVANTLTRIQNEISILPIQAAPDEFSYRNRAQFKTDGSCIGFEAANSNQLIAIDDCLILTEKNRRTLKSLLARLPNREWQPKIGKRNKKPQWVSLDIDENTHADQVSVNQRLPFQQGNSTQNKFMQTWLAQHLEKFSSEQTVLELFCGAGNFTEIIAAQKFTKIIAAELDVRAVTDLQQRQLTNTQAVQCNLYEDTQLRTLLSQARDAQLVVLDPPRDGFKNIAELCSQLRELENIFYISCDLATFGRDAGKIIESGFALTEVQPLDLFPQTPHVELLGKFSLK